MSKLVILIDNSDENVDWIKTPENKKSEADIHAELRRKQSPAAPASVESG